MATKDLENEAQKKYPYVFRNNRGFHIETYINKKGKKSKRIIRYGIPEPKGKEKDTDLKGGDFIGFSFINVTEDMVGKKIPVFTNIEIKGPGDVIKLGQLRWHNLMLNLGCKSEIWKEKNTGEIEIIDYQI